MSTDLSDVVLDEAVSRGETLTIHDLLWLIERFDTGPGVPEDLLLDTAFVFGSYTYKQAMAEVDRLREEDRLDGGADQHPNARLRLTPAGADHLGIDPEADDIAVKTGTDRTKDPRIDE